MSTRFTKPVHSQTMRARNGSRKLILVATLCLLQWHGVCASGSKDYIVVYPRLGVSRQRYISSKQHSFLERGTHVVVEDEQVVTYKTSAGGTVDLRRGRVTYPTAYRGWITISPAHVRKSQLQPAEYMTLSETQVFSSAFLTPQDSSIRVSVQLPRGTRVIVAEEIRVPVHGGYHTRGRITHPERGWITLRTDETTHVRKLDSPQRAWYRMIKLKEGKVYKQLQYRQHNVKIITTLHPGDLVAVTESFSGTSMEKLRIVRPVVGYIIRAYFHGTEKTWKKLAEFVKLEKGIYYQKTTYKKNPELEPPRGKLLKSLRQIMN